MKENNTDIASRILFEDNHLLVVNKLPSEIVQGDKTGDQPMSEALKEYIKVKYHKPGAVFLGVIHRIDRPVSGVVAFARTSKALTRMNEMVKERIIRKTYWAIVANKPRRDQETLVHYMVKDEVKNKSRVYDTEKPGLVRAELDYKVLAASDRYFLLEVDLKTGRHHQIRAQLAAIGCPVKGDLKYGYPRSNENASIHLHARVMAFEHPVTKLKINITADPPKDALWNYFLSLENNPL